MTQHYSKLRGTIRNHSGFADRAELLEIAQDYSELCKVRRLPGRIVERSPGGHALYGRFLQQLLIRLRVVRPFLPCQAPAMHLLQYVHEVFSFVR